MTVFHGLVTRTFMSIPIGGGRTRRRRGRGCRLVPSLGDVLVLPGVPVLVADVVTGLLDILRPCLAQRLTALDELLVLRLGLLTPRVLLLEVAHESFVERHLRGNRLRLIDAPSRSRLRDVL